MRILILATVAALALGSIANATQCKDPKTGKFIKCPPAAAATATPAKAAAPASPAKPATPAATASTAKKPNCTKGVACGNSCIAVGKVCHKPT